MRSLLGVWECDRFYLGGCGSAIVFCGSAIAFGECGGAIVFEGVEVRSFFVGCEGGAIVFLWDVEVRSLLGCGNAIAVLGM
jgi:hypothetical protein